MVQILCVVCSNKLLLFREIIDFSLRELFEIDKVKGIGANGNYRALSS